MKCAAAAFVVLLTTPVFAQIYSGASEAPIVTAENDGWYRRGEPLVFAGAFYYPAGAVVFFNGNVMVRTGHYNGVPLYADTTLEPYSVVFVPIGRNQMQPYERRRDGELAGTSGSRAPSFPGQSDRSPREILAAGGSPSNLPLPIDIISEIASARAVGTTGRFDIPQPDAIDAFAPPPLAAPPRRGKPFSYDSVSVQYMGQKWVMEGPSIEMPRGLSQVNEYKGFPVYAEKGREHERIYLPLTPGRLAPFTPKR